MEGRHFFSKKNIFCFSSSSLHVIEFPWMYQLGNKRWKLRAKTRSCQNHEVSCNAGYIFRNLKKLYFQVFRKRTKFTVGSTLVRSKILKKGKCICITIEMSFKRLISVPIYVRSIEKHVRHLVWTFFLKKLFC